MSVIERKFRPMDLLEISIRKVYPIVIIWCLFAFLLFSSISALIQHNWIITPVSFFAAAFANATAIGGGFLFVPLFIIGYGLTPVAALKLSLATQAFGMSGGTIGWSTQLFIKRSLFISMAAGAVGMLIGSFIWIPDGKLVKLAFGVVSFFIAIAVLLEMLFSKGSNNQDVGKQHPALEICFFIVCVFGGLINSWVSMGIGEVVALWLLFVHRIQIEKAIATGVAVLAFCSILGAFIHGFSGGIRWDYLAFTAPGALVGGYYGAKWGKKLEFASKSWKFNERLPKFLSKVSPLKAVLLVVVILDGAIIFAI